MSDKSYFQYVDCSEYHKYPPTEGVIYFRNYTDPSFVPQGICCYSTIDVSNNIVASNIIIMKEIKY